VGLIAVALGTSVAVSLQLLLHKLNGEHQYEMIDYGNPGALLIGFLMGGLDQVDMLIGVWVVIWPFVSVTIRRVISSVLFLFIAHQILFFMGYHFGMRSTSR
jgi:hypothetical protein